MPLARRLSGVSTIETDLRFSGREEFWIIVAARSEDETEIRAGKAAGGRRDQGHSARNPATLFSWREDPHRTGRAARGGEHRRALPPRGHRLIDVLWLVEGVPRGR